MKLSRKEVFRRLNSILLEDATRAQLVNALAQLECERLQQLAIENEVSLMQAYVDDDTLAREVQSAVDECIAEQERADANWRERFMND